MYQIIIIIISILYLKIVTEAAVIITNKLLLIENSNNIIFYDPVTNETLLPPVITWLTKNSFDSGTTTTTELRQRPSLFRRPCSCNELNCGCCVGVNFPNFNFRRQMCTNFTYEPNEFAIQMDVHMNENSIYQNMVSAKNPEPICVPVPYIPTAADMCIKLFNIFTPGRNIHMCMDLMVRMARQPIIVLHFDCMRMGMNGVALVKPDQNGGLDLMGGVGGVTNVTVDNSSTMITESPQTDYDIYDEITEIKIN